MKLIGIKGDGTQAGTKVVDCETGEEFKGIRAIEFQHCAGELPKAILEVLHMPIDIKAEPQYMVADPRTGELRGVARIEWADGDKEAWQP